jgi:hypothetical protein
MARYPTNEGKREYAIRLGCERGIYLFIGDYAKIMGMSMSGALRRLVLIGARCEAEHGKATMPASYGELQLGSSAMNDALFGKMQKDGSDDEYDWS